MDKISSSFPPIIGEAPQVLILGTLPSKVSIAKQEYYGHPQNKFWPIIYALFEGEFQQNYSAKVAFAKQHHVAIWDVCYSAIRPGSLDADISDEAPNRIAELLKEYSNISVIGFNGKKAEQLFFKYFKPQGHLRYLTLLSSSPANAAYSFEEKIENWRKLF